MKKNKKVIMRNNIIYLILQKLNKNNKMMILYKIYKQN